MKPCSATPCDNTAAVDLVLCWSDRNRIHLDALDLVVLHDELLDIAATGTGSGDGPRVSGGEERLGIDLDDRLVEARNAIRQTLGYWAGMVYAHDQHPKRYARPVGVRECGQLVAAAATWIARQAYAGEVSDDLRALVDTAGALIQRDPERSVRTVAALTCRQCGGELRAVMRRSTSLRPSVLACDQGHQLLPHEWAELVDDQDVAGDLVDAATAGAALGNSADAIHALARRGRLTRHDTADGIRYSLREARELAREWAA